MLFQPDQLIDDGKYRILAFLGQGASAEVYLVKHLKLDAPRSIKVLKLGEHGVGSTQFSEFEGRFRLEAQLGEKFRSLHLLDVHDFLDGDPLILIMEYAAGGSLATRIEQAREANEAVPIDEAVGIALDVAEGLSVIHDNDAVHRDIKPSNILFDRDGRAKVGDLGLAQTPHGPSGRSIFSQPLPHPGTPAYMSPEQANERGYLFAASDIYSLGLVLFEILTKRVYRNQKRGTRVSALRPDVPPQLDDLVLRMLDPNPDNRPFNGTEAVEALRATGIAPRWIPKRVVLPPPPPPVIKPPISAQPAPQNVEPSPSVPPAESPPQTSPATKAAAAAVAVAGAEKLASQKDKPPEPPPATSDPQRPTRRPTETSVPATPIDTTEEPPPTPAPAKTEPPPAVAPTDTPATVSPAAQAAAAAGGVVGTEKLASEKDKPSKAGAAPSSHAAPEPAKPEAPHPPTTGPAPVPALPPSASPSAAASPAPARPVTPQPSRPERGGSPERPTLVSERKEGDERRSLSILEDVPPQPAKQESIVSSLLVVVAIVIGVLVFWGAALRFRQPEPTSVAQQPAAQPAQQAAPTARAAVKAAAPTAAPAAGGAAPAVKGVPIKLWSGWTGTEADTLAAVAKQFEAATPGAQIQILTVPFDQLKNKYTTEASTGGGPDLLIGPKDWIGELAQAKLIASLDDSAQVAGLINVSKEAVTANSFQGKVYAFPESTEAMALFINTDKVKTLPTNSDDILKIAADQGLGLNTGFYQAAGFFFGEGAKLFDAQGKCILDQGTGAVDALKWIQTASKTPKVIADADGGKLDAAFKDGRVGMVFNGPWATGDYEKAITQAKLGVNAPIVMMPANSKFAPFLGTKNLFLSSNSKGDAKATSLAFMNFLSQPAQQETFSKIGHIPSNPNVNISDPILKGFIAQTLSTTYFPNEPEMGAVWTPAADMITKVVEGKSTPEEAVKTACSQINAANKK